MIATAVGDPDATRTVYGVVIGLAVIGVVLIAVAVWLIRQTKVDPELLAPLEQMETRRWGKRDPATQRRMLDDVRPGGAEPLHRERAVPALDEEFEAEMPAVAGFDDLKGGVDLSPEPAEEPAPDEVAVEPDGDEDAADPADAGDDVDVSKDAADVANDDSPVQDADDDRCSATVPAQD